MKKTTRDLLSLGVAGAVALCSAASITPIATTVFAAGETAIAEEMTGGPEEDGSEDAEPAAGTQDAGEVATENISQEGNLSSDESDDDSESVDSEEGDEAESEDEESSEERELYVTTWAERIDAFNEGFPLEGYGRVFAEAAWEYKIDPRFSPAIARMESTSGKFCFLPHNAWGWGDESWPDWETAIWEHVEGLSRWYGYTLTYETAEIYNQVLIDDWYWNVYTFMQEIWESDTL